ncbi:MAG: hypothetical protein ACAH80_03880 [Alphaproteobacteria bacterium]
MTSLKKLLLATTAGVVLLLAGLGTYSSLADQPVRPEPAAITATTTNTLPAPPAATAVKAPTLATIISDYNTVASKRLRSLEDEFNKTRAPGAPAIVFIDYDHVSTWYSMAEGPESLDKAIGDYLQVRTGKTYDAETLNELALAMDALQPVAFTTGKNNPGPCLVVPEYPGFGLHDFISTGFNVNGTNQLGGKILSLHITPQEFGDYANAHEAWHCTDMKFRTDVDGFGLVRAVKENRAETFADIGGVMESIKNGANLTIIDKVAAMRATWIYSTGPARVKHVPDTHPDHYKSIVYHTHPGLFALKERIQEMGMEKFRAMSRAEMREMAYEITAESSLTFVEAASLQTYYTTGKITTGAGASVNQLQEISAGALRNPTAAEKTAMQQDSAAAEKITAAGDSALVVAMRKRADELGGQNFANKLKARQEMTDRLREQFTTSTARKSTEAQLKSLLYSDPHLSVPKPPGS